MSANDELKPCPKCGSTEIVGRVCGGEAAYGCGEYEYEVECPCGILFNTSHTSETAEKAKEMGIAEWNARAEHTCEWRCKKSGTLYDVYQCSECKYEYAEPRTERGIKNELIDANYCPSCGAKVVEE